MAKITRMVNLCIYLLKRFSRHLTKLFFRFFKWFLRYGFLYGSNIYIQWNLDYPSLCRRSPPINRLPSSKNVIRNFFQKPKFSRFWKRGWRIGRRFGHRIQYSSWVYDFRIHSLVRISNGLWCYHNFVIAQTTKLCKKKVRNTQKQSKLTNFFKTSAPVV